MTIYSQIMATQVSEKRMVNNGKTSKIAIHLFSWIVLSFSWTATGIAQSNEGADNLRAVQRLALQTTGDLPTMEEEKSALAGSLSPAEFLINHKTNKEMRKRLGAFWLKQLAILESINYLGSTASESIPGKTRYTSELWLAIANVQARLGFGSASLQYGGAGGAQGGSFDCPGDVRRYKLVGVSGGDPRCEDGLLVAPYWDPRTKIIVPPIAVTNHYCGPDLSRCLPIDIRYTAGTNGLYTNNPDPANHFAESINDIMTWEAGYIAADAILTERPWSEVLTSPRGFVNGAFVAFLKSFGTIALAGGPELSYRSVPNGPLTLPNLDPWDATPVATNRGSDHSGVLTTFAFHAATNGRRAKAVRARTAFLCEEPIVSHLVKPIASDEKNLMIRPYCSSCHITIEPMATFFNQWPAAGVEYVHAKNRDAPGSFRGVSGNGVKDFAKILTQSSGSAFGECAVQRSFEFLTGAPLSPEIRKLIMQKALPSFTKGNENVWEIMLAIVGEKWLWK